MALTVIILLICLLIYHLLPFYTILFMRVGALPQNLAQGLAYGRCVLNNYLLNQWIEGGGVAKRFYAMSRN